MPLLCPDILVTPFQGLEKCSDHSFAFFLCQAVWLIPEWEKNMQNYLGSPKVLSPSFSVGSRGLNSRVEPCDTDVGEAGVHLWIWETWLLRKQGKGSFPTIPQIVRSPYRSQPLLSCSIWFQPHFLIWSVGPKVGELCWKSIQGAVLFSWLFGRSAIWKHFGVMSRG